MPYKNEKLFAKGLEYEILFYFKKDSSKQVFKALRSDPSTGLKQEVLVKVFLEDQYKEEFESLSQVDSPYCVRLLGFENFGSKKALILEYVKGVSLFQLVEHFHLTEEEISYILSGIYQGLKEIHSYGFCHGDLSLDNVLIDDKAQIKMIDFGQANYKKDSYGTAPFIAPELLKGFPPHFLSDLYSLGVVEAVLKKRIRLSELKSLSCLENTSSLLSSDPVKRKFEEELNLSNSSLIFKVKELLSIVESRRCSTVKNPSSKKITFLKPALFSLFFVCFLGGASQKENFAYGLIKVYTHEWFFIENPQFQSYTPFHLLLKEGAYWLKWKNRLSQGKKKVFVAKEEVLLLDDDFFLNPEKLKPKRVSLLQKFLPKSLKVEYSSHISSNK